MKPFTALLVMLAMLAPLAAPTVAIAAPRRGGDPTTVDKDDAAIDEAARVRFAEGQKLYQKRRYEEARAAFMQAVLLKRRPQYVLMLGQSCLRGGRWLEAAKNFDAYYQEVGGEVPAKIKEAFDTARREAKSHLGRLRFDVPEGAEVTIDGEKVASVETPVDVNAGAHTIVVSHRDEKKTVDVEAVAGSTVEVKPAFLPKALVPTSDTRTRPTPAAGKETSETPSESSAGSSGSGSASGGGGGGGGSGTSILSPPSTTWPVFAAGAIGLGGLAAAAIFGGLAANSNHAVDVANQTLQNENPKPTCGKGATFGSEEQKKNLEETCITLRRNQNFAAQHENAFGVSLIIGLSGTAIALGWFLFAPKEGASPSPPPDTKKDSRRTPPPPPPSLRPSVVPWVGLGSGGASLQGRF